MTCLAQERTPGASAKRPLTRAQLMGLVAGGVPNWRVAAFVRERGIAFQPSPEFLTDLKSVGASDGLLDSVRLAQRDAVSDKEEDHNTMPAPTDGSAPPDELKRLQQTEKQDRAAEVVRPHDPSVHFALAYVLAQEGKWDEAAAQYAAVISSQPSDVVVRNNLGLALRKSGDVDGAIREYRQALAIDPAFSETHDNLGVALMEKGDVDGAVAEFGEAVRQNPKNSQAHANLGVMLERRKDLDGAINEYRQALGVGGGEEVQLNLATALELKGDLDGAIAEFHQTLTTHPNDPRAHAGLAGALERQGDLTGALEQYAIAMKLAPEDSAIRADYERLAKASSTQMRRSSGG
ncbi:MAG TPA: tetratricopeptide repeat protein [Terriglobia bacterium]|nr:tetratricopeptide repeat protein [Terriglobia bacterium]